VVGRIEGLYRTHCQCRICSLLAGTLISMCTVLAGSAYASAAPDRISMPGRVVYLDFWASWCGPCRQSFPWMEKLKQTYAAQGLEILTVNLDGKRADADRFLNQFHPTFGVRFDPAGQLAELYQVQGMPSSVIIDRHGVTRFVHVGFRPIDAPAYEAQVRELLAEK
jgi:thiol-disulfide isomerase/thioredoxin